MKVYFSNLGCKLNQAEVDTMSRRFVAAGHTLAPSLEGADLHVVNSCTVTHMAARDSRKTARRGAARYGPHVRTVLTGCYATEKADEAAALAGVDLVVPNAAKDELLERVHRAFPEMVPPPPVGGPMAIPYVPLDFGKARALVKVEDGCNMGCSFCIIPTTRGRQRSRPVGEVVEEIRALARGGYQEIVVTGVQISEYRDGEHRLYDLLRAVLEHAEVPRIRVTSIAPWKFDRRLLTLWDDRRLCRHIHMSLQSGSTATLRRMRRPYRAEQYADLVGELRSAIPGLAVTTDVIVGFPGETDEEFEESLEFMERLAFAKPHVFTYSERDGTPAASLPGSVEHSVKKERTRRMLEVAARSAEAFQQQSVGQEVEVLWEDWRDGTWRGLTDHYLRVTLAGSPGESRSGTRSWVRLERLGRGSLEASELVPPSTGSFKGRSVSTSEPPTRSSPSEAWAQPAS